MSLLSLLVTILSVQGFAQKVYRLPLRPLDFQDEAAFYTDSTNELGFDGKYLYTLNGKSGEFFQISPAGKLIRVIGKTGGGPGEFSGPPLGLGITGNRLCVISPNLTAHIYIGGEFAKQFRLAGYLTNPLDGNSNSSAFIGPFAVIPAGTSSRGLAYAYHLEDHSPPQLIGKALDFDSEVMAKKPYLNDTFWESDGISLFSAFDYFPLIQVFDARLAIVRQIHLDHPYLMDGFSEILNFEPIPRRSSHPMPLLFDMHFQGPYLYLLARKFLFRIDKETGKVLASYNFYGKGPEFEDMPPEHRLVLTSFVLLDDRRLVLSSWGRPWEHDFWLTELPD